MIDDVLVDVGDAVGENIMQIKLNSDGLRDAGKIKIGWLVADEGGPGASKKPLSVVIGIDKKVNGTLTILLADGREIGPLKERDLVWSALPSE